MLSKLLALTITTTVIATLTASAISSDESNDNLKTIPLKLSISSKQSVVAPGDDITLDIIVTNVSNEKVISDDLDDLMEYEFSILGPDTKPAQTTAYGKRLLEFASMGGLSTEYIPAGAKRLDREFHLNRIFDFSLSGEYSITLKVKDQFPYGNHGKPLNGNSNTIKISIKPPEDYRTSSREIILRPDANKPISSTSATSASPARK